MQCGLLGRKLGHSYSPQIHAMLADYSYKLWELEPEQLDNFFHTPCFSGLNVTIPYKKNVIPYLSELSPRAQLLGAVNTVIRREDGSLYGENTDYYGFLSMVRRSGLDVAGKKALVLGSGGASATATAVLNQLEAHSVVISRSGENNYNNLQNHRDASLIVNATPVGMFPHTGISPLNLDNFPILEGVMDMVYNPSRTRLLLDAEKKGLVCENGLWMLVAQAKQSAELFLQKSIDERVIGEIYSRLRLQMENIILIGMPGSGKSAIGALLAERLGRPFADADSRLEEKFGKTIPEIFKSDGESGFRAMETQVLEELGMQSGLVIATGGGCVTRPCNYPLLHQNGKIFCLNRNPDALPTSGRPLSQRTAPTELYRIRRPMYEAFADYQIDNNGDPEGTIEHIMEVLK